MIEARRRSELQERLKQRRLREWQAADRELEELAGESIWQGSCGAAPRIKILNSEFSILCPEFCILYS
jgi:hypothetical protein